MNNKVGLEVKIVIKRPTPHQKAELGVLLYDTRKERKSKAPARKCGKLEKSSEIGKFGYHGIKMVIF